jgi:hypothetical protein
MVEFGNVVAIVLLVVAFAVVVNLILAYRRHRLAIRSATEAALAQHEAAIAATRAEEDRAAESLWEVNRAAVKKLMQDILQQSGKTDLRLHEARGSRSMSLIGRSAEAGDSPLVTVGVRDGQFYYAAHTSEGFDGGEIESPLVPTVDDLRAWLTDLWTYE